jgi:hypothetical protein
MIFFERYSCRGSPVKIVIFNPAPGKVPGFFDAVSCQIIYIENVG